MIWGTTISTIYSVWARFGLEGSPQVNGLTGQYISAFGHLVMVNMSIISGHIHMVLYCDILMC